MKDKKALAAMLIAKVKPRGAESEEKDEGGGEGKEAAAQEIMDAVKAGDASRLAAALEDMIQMCY